MSPPPRAPGAAMTAIHSHLLELFPTAMQETMVAVMLTSPAGMLRSAVRGDSYPKPLIKVAEYVEMTPLEIAGCERKNASTSPTSTGRSSIGTHQRYDENQKIYLHIRNEFLDVRPLELVIRDPSLIVPNTADYKELLVLAEKRCGHWGIRKKKECHNANRHGDNPEGDEHYTPAL